MNFKRDGYFSILRDKPLKLVDQFIYLVAQSAGAVEYTDWISTEGKYPP